MATGRPPSLLVQRTTPEDLNEMAEYLCFEIFSRLDRNYNSLNRILDAISVGAFVGRTSAALQPPLFLPCSVS